MKRIFFKRGDILFKYTVLDYQIEGDFYIFTDVFDGEERKLHKEMYRGEETVSEKEVSKNVYRH